MEKYTCYCTAEQTRKALELGAPIEEFDISSLEGQKSYNYPTAEQMLGWLEEQGILCDVFPTGDYGNDGFGMRIMIKAKRLNRFESDAITYSTRKEATLAAINAALEYLSKNR